MIRIKDAKFVYVYNKDRKSLNIENLKVEQHDDNSGFKLFFDTFGMPIDYISGMSHVFQNANIIITTDEDIAESLLNDIVNYVNGKIYVLCDEVTKCRNYIGEMEELRNVINGNRGVK